MRVTRAVVGLTLSAVAATTVLTSSSAAGAAAKPGLVERWSAATAAPAERPAADLTAAATGCFPDPTGDAEPSDYPRADLTRFCVDHTGSNVALSAEAAQPSNPATDPAWAGATGVAWGLDTGGDSAPEFLVVYLQGEVLVHDANDTVRCEREPAFLDGRTYYVSLPVSCVGGATSLRVQAYMGYDSDPADPDAPVFEDITAVGGPVLADPVSRPAPLKTSRLAGADRFATAVAISRSAFPNGAPVVYVARADAYADALAGGALTRGPVLLVPRCGTVPASVKAEVARLGPVEVVALGGASAVCDAVLAQVAQP